MDPLEIDLIGYKKGKLDGDSRHDDGCSMFGTIIIVINDTEVDSLHVEDTDIPESLRAVDVIIIDFTCIHQVAKAVRSIIDASAL